MKKSKEAKVDKLLGIAFGACGGIMLLAGVGIAIVCLLFKSGAEKINGTVLSTGSDTQVAYVFDGVAYEERTSLRADSIHTGDEIAIYVNKDKPSDFRIADFLFFPAWLLCGIAVPFCAVGAVFLILVVRRGRKKKRLLAEGKKLYAEVSGGEMNYVYTVNNRHPYKLECRYTDSFTGALYLFSSENTWLDPNLYIGRQIAVYVEASDYSKYYVDLESLHETDGTNGANVYDFR